MQDILLTDAGDLYMNKGDLQTGEADEQAMGLMLLTDLGAVKFDPLTGVGLQSYLHGNYSESEASYLRRKIAVNMDYEGFGASLLEVDDLENSKLEGAYEA